ncbi:MAG: lysozyme inhibitor LprI family protein [Desulfobacterales bacterium]
MSKTVVWTAMFCLLLAGAALSDQAAWVDKKAAYKAGEMIETGTELRRFCAPCGDTVWTPLVAKQVEVRNPEKNLYEIFVNDSGIDLAYVYIFREGKWRNLAMMLGLAVSDVPEFLPEKLPSHAETADTGESHPIDREMYACMDRDPSTANMINCIHVAAEKWDGELNRVYQDLRERLKPEAQKSLTEAQRAWIAYRDLEFKNIQGLYAGFEGTVYHPMRAESRMQITKNRVMELVSYLSLFEMGE